LGAGKADAMIRSLAWQDQTPHFTANGDDYSFVHLLLDTDGSGPPLGRLVENDFAVCNADCRLDNRDELLPRLNLPENAGDSDILLAAHALWGAKMPGHLLGDFAFAIWHRASRTLFAARDHFGVKPFYYYHAGEKFLFASDISALFAAGAPRRIKDAAIADFLTRAAPPASETSFEGIKLLPPGHWLSLQDGALSTGCYYQLELPEIRKHKNAPAEFRRLLTAAVHARLRGAPKLNIGAMLSGGLDSSSIACLAATKIPNLPTLSMVFDETPEFNERPFIETVLAQGGFAPIFIPSNALPPFAEVTAMIREQTDLFNAPNIGASRMIYHVAREAGLRVLLDGHGGDEVAPVGFTRLHELAIAGHWRSLWRAMDGAMPETNARLKLYGFWKYFRRHTPLWLVFRLPSVLRRRLGLLPRSEDEGLLNPDFAARIAQARQAPEAKPPAHVAFSERHHHFSVLTGPLQAHAFEILSHMAAAAGVEARYPFWDKRLVEFCLSLEPAEKFDAGFGRLILRRAMEGVLPERVRLRRDKLNFMPHIVAGMFKHHQSLIGQLCNAQGPLGNYVNLAALRKAASRAASAPANKPDGLATQQVWRATILAFWLQAQAPGEG